jgi:hypothetical protein
LKPLDIIEALSDLPEEYTTFAVQKTESPDISETVQKAQITRGGIVMKKQITKNNPSAPHIGKAGVAAAVAVCLGLNGALVYGISAMKKGDGTSVSQNDFASQITAQSVQVTEESIAETTTAAATAAPQAAATKTTVKTDTQANSDTEQPVQTTKAVNTTAEQYTAYAEPEQNTDQPGNVNMDGDTRSKKALIEKYMPDGAYDICQRNYDEHGGKLDITYYDADDKEIDVIAYVQELMDDLQVKSENMTEEEYRKAQEELAQKTVAICQSADHRAYVYNDYRCGWDHQQWFKNCEYADGFWYVLREDGSASIVGAEQEYFKGKEVLVIPSEIGGAAVKEIECGAFTSASIYFQDITEIVIPDSVEMIGEVAFSRALLYIENGKINLPDGVKVIGRCAFKECMQNLADEFNVIHVPESVEYLGCSAFGFWEDFYNSNVDSTKNYHLDMPDSLVLMEEQCFSNPENAKHIFLNGEANFLYMDDVAAYYEHNPQ